MAILVLLRAFAGVSFRVETTRSKTRTRTVAGKKYYVVSYTFVASMEAGIVYYAGDSSELATREFDAHVGLSHVVSYTREDCTLKRDGGLVVINLKDDDWHYFNGRRTIK